MSLRDQLFELMRRTEMNEWVGGGDPALVGLFCMDILRRMTTIGPRSRVVDFGCGIGRVAVQLLSSDLAPRGYLGIDMMPAVIDFCRSEIQPHFASTAFEIILGSNEHYDRRVDARSDSCSTGALSERYGYRFTHGFAFSVFTHLYAAEFVEALRFLGSLVGAGGEIMFTAFTLTDFSRAMIASGATEHPLDAHKYLEGGDLLIGDPADPLAFIAYDRTLIETMVARAGLIVTKIEYGTWMGGKLGTSLQDVYVCRKPRRPTTSPASIRDTDGTTLSPRK